jgi:hypothetical protein
MLDLINSLSFTEGAFLVALASALSAIGWGYMKTSRTKWALVVGVPYLFAHSLYWSPVWLGEHPSEFSAWAVIFILPWYLSGLFSSLLVAYVISRRLKTRY